MKPASQALQKGFTSFNLNKLDVFMKKNMTEEEMEQMIRAATIPEIERAVSISSSVSASDDYEHFKKEAYTGRYKIVTIQDTGGNALVVLFYILDDNGTLYVNFSACLTKNVEGLQRHHHTLMDHACMHIAKQNGCKRIGFNSARMGHIEGAKKIGYKIRSVFMIKEL